jgi:hypothetical protein
MSATFRLNCYVVGHNTSHIFAVEVDKSDDVNDSACQKIISKALSELLPLKSLTSSEYREYQHHLPIYDGRYDANYYASTTAPPVQLFHPVFAYFLDNLANTGNVDIPDDVFQATVAFMRSASGIYQNEDDRKDHVVGHLVKMLRFSGIGAVNDATLSNSFI